MINVILLSVQVAMLLVSAKTVFQDLDWPVLLSVLAVMLTTVIHALKLVFVHLVCLVLD